MDTGTLWLIATTSFGVGFSGAAAPGPMLAYTVRQSVRLGGIAGPLVVLGHALLEMVLVLALVRGISRLLTADPVLAAISLLGGVFLLWMGYGLVRNPGAQIPESGQERRDLRGWWRTPLAGAVVSVSNPFWTIWWATIGLGYLVWAQEQGGAGVTAFYLGHIMSDFVWFTFIAVGVASGRRFLGPTAYRWLLAGCGVFLLVFGVWFLWNGIQRVLGG